MALPNVQHSSKWKLHFSNVPSITNQNELQSFELYVKSFSFPDLDLNIVKSNFRNYEIQHQVSHANDELASVSVVFKLSEDMENYYKIYFWMQAMKYGINLNKDLFRLNTIKAMTLTFLDNEARPISKYVFHECFVKSLSSLDLTQGTEDELSFTLTIVYENLVHDEVEQC